MSCMKRHILMIAASIGTLAACGSSQSADQKAISACENAVLDATHTGSNYRFDSVVAKPHTNGPDNYRISGNLNGTPFQCVAIADGHGGFTGSVL